MVVEAKVDVLVHWSLVDYNRETDRRVYLYLPNADSPNLVLLLEDQKLTLLQDQAVDQNRVYYPLGSDHDLYRVHNAALVMGYCSVRPYQAGTTD